MVVIFFTFSLFFNDQRVSSQVLSDSSAKNGRQYLIEATAATEEYLQYGSRADLKKAISSLEASLEMEGSNPYAVRLLAELEGQNDSQLSAQIEKVKNILTIRPDYAAAWLRLSLLYRDEGNNQMADSALGQAKNSV